MLVASKQPQVVIAELLRFVVAVTTAQRAVMPAAVSVARVAVPEFAPPTAATARPPSCSRW